MKSKEKFKFRPLYIAIIYFVIILFFVTEALTAEHLEYSYDFVGWGGTFRYNNVKIMGLSPYIILMISSVLISIGISLLRRKKNNRSIAVSIFFPLSIFAVCFIGAKLLFIIENLKTIRQNGISFDGFSLFGAILITPIVAFCVSKFSKDKTAKLLDEVIYYELIMLIALRTGCFLQGCCKGITLWSKGLPIVLPVQLFEVFLDLIILDFCIKIRDSKGSKGRMYPWFMMLYSSARFALEFLRNTPKSILGLSNGQMFSIICFAIGLLLLKYFNKKR